MKEAALILGIEIKKQIDIKRTELESIKALAKFLGAGHRFTIAFRHEGCNYLIPDTHQPRVQEMYQQIYKHDLQALEAKLEEL